MSKSKSSSSSLPLPMLVVLALGLAAAVWFGLQPSGTDVDIDIDMGTDVNTGMNTDIPLRPTSLARTPPVATLNDIHSSSSANIVDAESPESNTDADADKDTTSVMNDETQDLMNEEERGEETQEQLEQQIEQQLEQQGEEKEKEEEKKAEVISETQEDIKEEKQKEERKPNTNTLKATFINKSLNPVSVHWIHPHQTNDHRKVIDIISPNGGRALLDTVHRGHSFVVQDEQGTVERYFKVPLSSEEGGGESVIVEKDMIEFIIENDTEQQQETQPQPQSQSRPLDATFVNEHPRPIAVFWYNPKNQEERLVIQQVNPNAQSATIRLHTGHTFIVYEVKGNDQNSEDIHIEKTIRQEITVPMDINENETMVKLFIHPMKPQSQSQSQTQPRKEEEEKQQPPQQPPQNTAAVANFINQSSHSVSVYWYNPKSSSGEKRLVIRDILPNASMSLNVHYGHTFLVYRTVAETETENGQHFMKEFIISASNGHTEDLVIADRQEPESESESESESITNTAAEANFIHRMRMDMDDVKMDVYVDIYWIHPRTKEERKVIDNLRYGDARNIKTHHGHAFVAKAKAIAKANGAEEEKYHYRKEMIVTAHSGRIEDFIIDGIGGEGGGSDVNMNANVGNVEGEGSEL